MNPHRQKADKTWENTEEDTRHQKRHRESECPIAQLLLSLISRVIFIFAVGLDTSRDWFRSLLQAVIFSEHDAAPQTFGGLAFVLEFAFRTLHRVGFRRKAARDYTRGTCLQKL